MKRIFNKTTFLKNAFNTNSKNFEKKSLNVFRFQSIHNPVYKKFISQLKINLQKINSLEQIPFLPTELYKNQKIKSGTWKEEIIFKSSCTTGQIPSINFIKDKNFYLKTCKKNFENAFGNIDKFLFLVLMPLPEERPESSLLTMMDFFITESKSPLSGYYYHNQDKLPKILKDKTLRKGNKKLILFGLTYCLLDFAENFPYKYDDFIVIETGGMKGKRPEMIKNELYSILKTKLNVSQIYSEYGMTELCSQAYTVEEGIFRCPPWMKVILRDLQDPLNVSYDIKYGGVNIIDLCNIDTCSFLSGQDIGRIYKNGTFEIMGRVDSSELRGCNLMLEN